MDRMLHGPEGKKRPPCSTACQRTWEGFAKRRKAKAMRHPIAARLTRRKAVYSNA